MNKKIIALTLLIILTLLLTACQNGSFNHEHVWSKYYDNGDGTHTRTCLKDINHKETSQHEYILDSITEEASDVTPGKEKYKCSLCGATETRIVAPTGKYVFDQKLVDDKYIYKRLSEHSVIYYMSSIEGAYGNTNYLFEKNDLGNEYTEVEYAKSDGTQYIDTGITNNNEIYISYNGANTNGLSDLPAEYQKIEYIQSTGNQYINTGYILKSECLKIEFAAHIPFSQSLSLFGSNDSNYDLVPFHSPSYRENSFYHWIGSSKSIFEVAYDSDYNNVTYSLNNGTIYCTVNGRTTTSTYNGSIISNQCFYIFGKNENDVSKERGEGYRLFSFKMYDNEILVRDYIPCYRKGDNEIGLYDKVNDEFYQNVGSGEFIKGREIIDNYYEDFSAIERHKLPSGYNQLAYIISSSIQSLKTGVFGASKIELTGTFLGNNNLQIMGYDLNLQHSFGVDDNDKYLGTDTFIGNKDYIVWDCGDNENDKVSLKVNGTELYKNNLIVSIDNSELKLFSSGSNNGCSLKFYGAKIYQNGTLIRNYIPAKSIYSNRIGVYDLVQDKFYESSTTSSFEAGSNMDLDINMENINIFVSNNSNEKILIKDIIHDYKIYDFSNNLIRDFISCIRNIDGKIGFYELIEGKFYTNSTGNELSCGKIIGHQFEESKELIKPNHSIDGDIVHICSICKGEVHEKVERTAFKVDFILNGAIEGVKVFSNNDPNMFVITSVEYTRNINTYNYSKVGAYILFEVISSDNKNYTININNGTLEHVEGDKYRIVDINYDCIVEIKEEDN